MLLEAKNITFSINKKPIIKNIDFSIGKGEIICLLGPSGVGKTTLMRNLVGQLSPQEGEVTFEGRKLPFKGFYPEVGYMLQDSTLYEHITVLDNLNFFAGLNSIKNKKERIEEMLDFADLLEHRNKLVYQLSGGMKRRLSLAITLLHNPKVIFLDEPTVGIDPVLREKFWSEFMKIRAMGVSIVVTTHIMHDAERCDKIFIMKDGIKAGEGSPEELCKQTDSNSLERAYLIISQ